MQDFDYIKVTDELCKKINDIQKADIFYYQGTPLESICNDLFQFFQNSFHIDFQGFGVEPAYMFFGSDISVNGWALRKHDCSVVCIYIGAVQHLASAFLDHDNLISITSNRRDLEVLQSLLRNSVNNTLLQAAYLFFFYHELGHLIQRSNIVGKKLMETKSEGEEYSKDKHVRESDADLFAGIQLSRQILNKFDKLDNRSENTLISFVSVVAAGAGLFMLMKIEFSSTLYIKEKSHPHSLIRLVIILDTIVNYTLRSMGISNTEMQVREDLIRSSITLIDDLLPVLYGSTSRLNLIKIYSESRDDVVAYAKELIDNVKVYKAGALAKWNLKALQ